MEKSWDGEKAREKKLSSWSVLAIIAGLLIAIGLPIMFLESWLFGWNAQEMLHFGWILFVNIMVIFAAIELGKWFLKDK